MRPNEMSLKRPYYTVRTANIALLVLLLGYLALEIAELVMYFFAGQSISTEQYIIASLFVDVPVLLIAFLSVHPVQALRFRKTSIANLGYTILLTIFSYLALGVLLNLISTAIRSAGGEIPEDAVSTVMDEQPFILEFLLYCVFAPLTEEILFRGMIQNAYERKMGFCAFVVSGVLFGAIHADPMSMLNATLLGFVMGLVYLRTRSIWCPILFHGLFNLMAFTYLPDIGILNLPWAMEWLPVETMTFADPFYTVYQIAIGVASGIMVFILLRKIFYANPVNRSEQVVPYIPQSGENAMMVWCIILLGMRAAPFIMSYFM